LKISAACRNRFGRSDIVRTRRGGAPNIKEISMEYMLLIHSDPKGWESLTETQRAEGLAAYGAYYEALNKAGVLRNSNRLRPADTATTVRLRDGKTEVLNGPFIETREQLGGYFLIDVPDLDAALGWAARCPGASHGAVEVRPVWPM
jgi:hypothetical protein